ncbi:hypothetical protein [Endozoicomonas sp. ISHI1]|uniref:hypothetical protein n=4 Tax=unclassified Endozoicomonas TaxID=2644528 RepID=UPI0021494541|nr:hypothetical protein [Endozoicomonas sp. ISHI1]
MKKLFRGVGVLHSSVIVLAFLLTSMVSVAGEYVLNFQTLQRNVKLYLSVIPDTETDGPSGAQGLQEQPSQFLPNADTESQSPKRQKPETIGGLPVSESSPSARHTLPELTSSGNDENKECGAAGGLTASQACKAVSSPVSVTLIDSDDRESSSITQPLTTQPGAGPTINLLQTGTNAAYAWLERGVPGEDVQFFQMPSSQLQEFVMVFASLVAMNAGEIYTRRPFLRCGRYIFNSDVNPSWSRGRCVTPCMFVVGAAGTGGGLGAGLQGLGYGFLTAGLLSTLCTACLFSHTRFHNQINVSFTLTSNNLSIGQEIYNFKQIVKVLQCSGGYNLVSFQRDRGSHKQTLTFNVRVPDHMSNSHLKAWLERSNQQLIRPFQIDVRSISDPTNIFEPRTDH